MAGSSVGLTPRKFGLTFSPPSLTVTYTANERKTRRRNIPVRNLSAKSDATAVAAQLATAHADLLSRVQPAQLESLVRRLVEAVAKRDAASAAWSASCEASSASAHPAAGALGTAGAPGAGRPAGGAAVGGSENLNALDDAALAVVKAEMDVGFSASRLRPGDPGYVYDKRVEFAPPHERSEWDDELEDFSSSEEDDLFGKRGKDGSDGLLP
ncbi:hypothetical protein KFE25_005659 [Diacronema lutheri]|uniref:Centrosomal protein of 19 kDa n=1 Tax=Diacronema lutheri TaxID=2081491 RepID=A0A8J6CB16_DIALT|nr:hypothetical protein KFE25_005659 [Diacronema lutheri]